MLSGLNPLINNEENCKIKLNALSASLNHNFPINGMNNFTIFAFSNEGYFDQALLKLNNTTPIESSYIKIALLFGESRFLSMLPELAKHVTLIILADIEPQLHAHTKHLLNCMIKASSTSEFINYYKMNNPVLNKDSWSIDNLLEGLNGKDAKYSLGGYHFLSSEQRFNQCKDTLNKLLFVNINLNLLNEKECERFSTILDNHSACLAFCNFTNIHHYDESYKLKLTTELLLSKSPGCFFMYATGTDRSGSLTTNFSVNLNDYYNLTETYLEPKIEIQEYDFELDLDCCVIAPPNINTTNLPQPKPFRSMLLHDRYGLLFTSSLGKQNDLEQNNDQLLQNSEVLIENDQTLKF